MHFSLIVYFAFAYLVGAIPSGYLFTAWSTKKNILEIGWRKTSGSNVFKNVGKWQGIATVSLDAFKGFIVVWLGQYFDFSDMALVFGALAALVGNNWSAFINFSGGRGLALIAGAMLFFSWQLLAIALVPIIISALLWTSSIGIFIAFGVFIFLSPFFYKFSTAGLFMLTALAPIFLKRLSPWRELSLKKPGVIANRLIFDDDTMPKEARCRKLMSKLGKSR
jgi:glycerol-3-phosphate acyltransferase PlsY